MTFAGAAEVEPLRRHIRSLVESGDLKQGTILRADPFAIDVFFGHPGWTGNLIGYRINIAPTESNFTTLRRLCRRELGDEEQDDFVGPIIVHQMNAETINITRDGSRITLDLIRDPRVPTRYERFKAPGIKEFTFKSEEAAERAHRIAHHIIEKSTAYMREVEQKFGIHKDLRRTLGDAQEESSE